MTYCLCIDTSIFGASMALVELGAKNSVCLWEETFAERHGSAAILSHLWERAQAATGLNSKDIEAMAVSTGPGSFTGIKVGLAWAYGFAAVAPKAMRWLELSGMEEAATALQARQRDKAALLVLASTQTHGYMAYAPALHPGLLGQKAPALHPGSLVQNATALMLDGTEPRSTEASFAPLGDLSKAEPALCYCVGSWPALPKVLASCASVPLKVEEITELAFAEVMQLSLRGMVQKLCDITQHKGLQALSLDLPQARYLRKSTAEEKLDLKEKTLP